MSVFDFISTKIVDKIAAPAGPSPTSFNRLKKLLYSSKHKTISPTSAGFVLQKIHAHRNHLKSSRIICQMMSNYCMRQEQAEMFVEQGAIPRVLRTMKLFPQDKQLAWLACSSLWNLCRPPATRNKIPEQTCAVLWECLKLNADNKKVVQCAVGALSNIAICPRFQARMLCENRLGLLRDVWDQYKDSQTVVTPACGLIANLAISDQSEDLLIDFGFLPRLLSAARTFNHEDITRNCAAALSNLSHGESFPREILLSKGVTPMFQMFEEVEASEQNQVSQLLLNAMGVIGLDRDVPMNALHVASRQHDCQLVATLLKSGMPGDADGNGQTPLDHAIGRAEGEDKLRIIELLASCNQTPTTNNGSSDAKMALSTGYECFAKTKIAYTRSIADAVPVLPMDLANELRTFLPGEDLHFASHPNIISMLGEPGLDMEIDE